MVFAAVAVAAVVVAATGVAVAGGNDRSRSRDVLVAPKIDAGSTHEAMLRHLVGQGMSPEQARQRMANQDASLRAVAELRTRAARGVGSVRLDADGHLMVQVLDAVGEREAKAVGATPVFSTVATADLEAVRDTLIDDALKNPPAGLSSAVFEIDEAAHKVVVRYLFEESVGVVPEAATGLGDLVTASAEVGSIHLQADVDVAGTLMRDPENDICTAAWAVDITDENGGVPRNGVMTAGHCFDIDAAPERTRWLIDTAATGDTPATGVLFVRDERGDYGVLELGNGDRGSTFMSASSAAVEVIQEPVEGASVCMAGAMTGVSCGEIERLNVAYLTKREDGTILSVGGVTLVGYCAATGDSGAPVFAEYGEGASGFAVAAVGIHNASVDYRDAQDNPVCGEQVGEPNRAFFTPLVNIDTKGKFHVRIHGG